jgi:hypothetical protein
MSEDTELVNFYESLLNELKIIQITKEEGGNLEQIFTEVAVDLLADAGETENVRVAYDEKALGTKNQHKINAYSISDNYETLDLFITIFKGTAVPTKVAKDEVDTASKRITNFFKKGIQKDYVNEIDESSQIFDFAHTLYKSKELKDNLVRVNVIILTNGIYQGVQPANISIGDFPIYFRIIDINYLYNISEKSHIPIEINFEEYGLEVSCLISPSENDQYQSYLAIIPGKLLAIIYEKYGARLLEQNVRSFLQSTGKTNKGIRNTIISEPDMFLAYNNGIAATAEDLKIELSKHGIGYSIKWIKDLQIVNGGQTTASIFHTLKKDRADISGIFVQLKLTVIKDKSNFSKIVSRISEYANTQNKVSFSDLSANNPFYIEIEKFSRLIFAPNIGGNSVQTRWFFERARGQYKNERAREGKNKAKLRAFDAQNPRKQLFTKEDLAKYINSYNEVISKSNKYLVGPFIVVRGNQKNHKAFIDHNLPYEVDNIYFEDLIAKAILFRGSEKVYGIKPNSIGDLRFVTVPYTISYLVYSLKTPINLYKIWKEQKISEELEVFLKELMIKIEGFIKQYSVGSLYTEWAKSEECWKALKKSQIAFDVTPIENDLIDINTATVRRKMNKEQIDFMKEEYQFDKISSISVETWKMIKEWGKESNMLTLAQLDRIHNCLQKETEGTSISYEEGINLVDIIEIVSKRAPELLIESESENDLKTDGQILQEQATKMIEWIKENKHSMDSDAYTFLKEIKKGTKTFSLENKTTVSALLKYLVQYGYNSDSKIAS